MIGQLYLSRATLMAASAALLLAAAPVSANSVADFYKGKQIRIVVVSGSGGLNALYARTLGDRMGKHVPGKPNFIYQYMPGGGGLGSWSYRGIWWRPRSGICYGQFGRRSFGVDDDVDRLGGARRIAC